MFGFLKKLFGVAPTETAAEAPYKVEAKPVEDLADIAIAQKPVVVAAKTETVVVPPAKTPAKAPAKTGNKPAKKAPAKKTGGQKPTGQKTGGQKPKGPRKPKAAKPAAK